MTLGKRHMQIAIVVMLATLVWNVYRSYWGGSSTTAAVQAPLLASVGPVPRADAPAAREVDPATIAAPPTVDLRAEPAWPRDPFLAPGESRDAVIAEAAPDPAGPDPVVRSILYSSDRRLALVDKRVVKIGDVIAAGTITDIQANAIVLRAPGGEIRRIELSRIASVSPAAEGVTRSK